jgi:hypothetical protein
MPRPGKVNSTRNDRAILHGNPSGTNLHGLPGLGSFGGMDTFSYRIRNAGVSI